MSDPFFVELDVRPLVESGTPPLSTILDAVDRLAPGQVLRLIAPFEPLPLYQMLGAQGFTHETSRGEDGAWVVVFRR